MTYEELKEAIASGHKASSVLFQVVKELSDKHYCPEAAGFEGPETFPDCGVCVYCLAKKLIDEEYID